MPLSNSPQGERTSPSYQTAAPSMWDSLKQNAQEHRKNPTEAESALWKYLKGEQLEVKFRRQHAIGFYIADFACLEKMLVIEVDGKYHEQQIVDDQLRANDIQQQGFEIIRFTNEEVLVDTENVIEKIKSKLNSLTSRKSGQVLPHGEDLGGASFDFEHSTMPGWAGSSWYFLRYMDNKNANEFVSKEAVDYWKQIDLYLGGSEHATGHLLYFRFWTKFLYDLGFIPFEEPAKKLINQGMIQGLGGFVYISGYKLSDSKEEGVSASMPVSLRGKQFFSDKIIHSVYSADFVDKYQLNSNISTSHPCVKIRIPINFIEKDDSFNLVFVETFLKNLDYPDPLFVNDFGYFFRGKFGWWDDVSNEEKLEANAKFYALREVEKMSKSKYNVVTPDAIVEDYGADTLRLYEMFLGPLEQSKPWNTQGIEGVHRFLKKLWKLFVDADGKLIVTEGEPSKKELKSLHKLIKKVGEDIENFSFNTSVPAFMICVNELTELKCNNKKILLDYLVCLSPYAPHVAEELWEALGNNTSITQAQFPIFNPEFLIEDSFSYPISINGKHRTNIEMGMDMAQSEVEQIVLADEVVQKWLEGKQPKKIIFVKGKIVNMVI
jgi:leucyl-tRNA synthetase/very-short-patch-repair endonuclease